ncbi:hypothetical protein V8C44DRAFT_274636 [Trichoderma aethiopicum]
MRPLTSRHFAAYPRHCSSSKIGSFFLKGILLLSSSGLGGTCAVVPLATRPTLNRQGRGRNGLSRKALEVYQVYVLDIYPLILAAPEEIAKHCARAVLGDIRSRAETGAAAISESPERTVFLRVVTPRITQNR